MALINQLKKNMVQCENYATHNSFIHGAYEIAIYKVTA